MPSIVTLSIPDNACTTALLAELAKLGTIVNIGQHSGTDQPEVPVLNVEGSAVFVSDAFPTFIPSNPSRFEDGALAYMAKRMAYSWNALSRHPLGDLRRLNDIGVKL